jgi:transcription-repair coupling factor (superfamily II helicase)
VRRRVVLLAALEGLTQAATERVVLPFPSHEIDPYRGMAPHIGVTSARARALYSIAHGSARVLIASAASLLPRVTTPERMLAASLELRPGRTSRRPISPSCWSTRDSPVKIPPTSTGNSPSAAASWTSFRREKRSPVRLEFIGDTIETLRTYDPSTQRSIAPIDQVALVPLRDVLQDNRGATVFDYVSRARDSRIIVSEADEVAANTTKLFESLQHSYDEALSRKERYAPPPPELFAEVELIEARLAQATHLAQLGLDDDAPGSATPDPAPRVDLPALHVRSQPAVEMKGRVADWVASIRRLRDDGEATLFVAANAGTRRAHHRGAQGIRRLRGAGRAGGGCAVRRRLVAVGGLSRGFRLPDAGLQIYAEADVFEEERRAPERRRSATKAFLSDLRDLKVGDFIVHVDHGIGMFVGLKQIGVGDSMQEFLELRYAAEDKLFVPVERLDLVQKYTGAVASADRPPRRNVLGACEDQGQEGHARHGRGLLKLYAARRAVPGHAFAPDSHWQQEFEDAFEYDLTIDQTSGHHRHQARHGVGDADGSAALWRRRLRQDRGRDARRIQGGHGRQAGRVPGADDDSRVQHQKTLRERFAGFPVRIDMVSRFRSKIEQKETITDLAAGKVDIIVGTHRLLSQDVQFRDLGLLVVDEEQRFGVAHKEKIKQMKRKVDVLTMSATPIPRTLNMSLIGIRDMSIIETPPKDRLSIQTSVVKFDQEIIRRSIRAEIERGGQVYFVHNRVESIFSIAGLVQRLVPEARVVVGHGQMDEEVLERAMLDFVAKKFDVLLATTIVENGLDIRTRTRSSSTAPIATDCRSSTSCGAASGDRIGRRTRICSSRRKTISPRSRRNGWRRSRSSAISAAGSAWPRSISRFAGPGTCSAASRAARSTRSASRCT